MFVIPLSANYSFNLAPWTEPTNTTLPCLMEWCPSLTLEKGCNFIWQVYFAKYSVTCCVKLQQVNRKNWISTLFGWFWLACACLPWAWNLAIQRTWRSTVCRSWPPHWPHLYPERARSLWPLCPPEVRCFCHNLGKNISCYHFFSKHDIGLSAQTKSLWFSATLVLSPALWYLLNEHAPSKDNVMYLFFKWLPEDKETKSLVSADNVKTWIHCQQRGDSKVCCSGDKAFWKGFPFWKMFPFWFNFGPTAKQHNSTEFRTSAFKVMQTLNCLRVQAKFELCNKNYKTKTSFLVHACIFDTLTHGPASLMKVICWNSQIFAIERKDSGKNTQSVSSLLKSVSIKKPFLHSSPVPVGPHCVCVCTCVTQTFTR